MLLFIVWLSIRVFLVNISNGVSPPSIKHGRRWKLPGKDPACSFRPKCPNRGSFTLSPKKSFTCRKSMRSLGGSQRMVLLNRQTTIKGLDNPTCHFFPISSKRKVKMGWQKRESEGGVCKSCAWQSCAWNILAWNGCEWKSVLRDGYGSNENRKSVMDLCVLCLCLCVCVCVCVRKQPRPQWRQTGTKRAAGASPVP